MIKKPKKIDLLFGELYAHCEKGITFYGVPIRFGRLSGEYEFLTENGVKTGDAQYCTRIWEKGLLEKYKELKNEARRK